METEYYLPNVHTCIVHAHCFIRTHWMYDEILRDINS